MKISQAKSGVDLVVIGGGPAGYTAAIKASLQGFSVVLVERAQIGGACINRGCIPTKALWGTAVSLQRLKDLEHHGITTSGSFSFDFGVAARRQFQITEHLAHTVRSRMLKLGVQLVQGTGKVQSRPNLEDKQNLFITHVTSSDGDRQLKSKFVLIATGSRPAETDLLTADHRLVVNTDDIVQFRELPKSLVIVGGGVVACEFAGIFNRFGVKVDLLEHSSQILSAMDPEVVGLLMEYFVQDGVRLHLHTKVTGVERLENGVVLTIDKNGSTEKIETETVLLAIGRKPNAENLGLEELGVRVTPRGHIVVNERLETDCPGIYAAGDVVGGPMLAHKAWYEASIALRAMSGEECRADYDTVPGAIFTIPEMASVGLHADQARSRGIRVAIGKFHYADNSQALCTGKTRGLVKAVIDRDTNHVVGCTIVGHDATNIISEVALAMEAGLTAKDIGNTIHPHPSLSEMIWESFLDTQGLSIHK